VFKNDSTLSLMFAKYSDTQRRLWGESPPARASATGARWTVLQASAGGLPTRRRLLTCPTGQQSGN